MPSDAYNAAVAAIKQQMQAANAGLPLDLATTRAGFEASYSSMPIPDGVNVAPVDAGGVPAEWVTPPEVEGNRTIMYLHGGGYVVGSLNTHRHVVSRMAVGARARLLNVDYRLAPENPFPAGQWGRGGPHRDQRRLCRWGADHRPVHEAARPGLGAACLRGSHFAMDRPDVLGRLNDRAGRARPHAVGCRRPARHGHGLRAKR